MVSVVKKLLPYAWVVVCLALFVWFAGPYLPKWPTWVQILAVGSVILVSTIWLFRMTLPKGKGKEVEDE